MKRLGALFVLTLGFGFASAMFHRVAAQEVKHPDMELIENDNGEEIVVVRGTGQPPDPKLYVVKEEEGTKGPILVVYYKPTGEFVTTFSKTTIKGKSEGPGVSLFANRVSPQIEKVIGQKSYEKEIKKRYLEIVSPDKAQILESGTINRKDIDKVVERRRN